MIHCDVLIIDDDMDDIEFLSSALTESGDCRVHFVHSTEEAFRYLNEVFPDCIPRLVVCDFFLTIGNAIDFVAALKEMPSHKDVVVIVWSSSLSNIREEKLRMLDVFDYHSKPISSANFRDFADLIKSKIRV